MTLGYSTHWPKHMGGGPTFFMEKILKGYPFEDELQFTEWWLSEDGRINHYLGDTFNWGYFVNLETTAKVHTLRYDPSDRWKSGNLIHPVIHNRTPKRFQFAPTTKCMGTQQIVISHYEGYVKICIDGKIFGEVFHHGLDDIYQFTNDVEILALNDGFESLEQFFKWFNKDFTGKIIHWTDLNY